MAASSRCAPPPALMGTFLVVLALMGCTSAKKTTETVPLGALLAYTGFLNTAGLSPENGIRAGEYAINAAGGVLGGKQLSLFTADSGSDDPNMATTADNNLVDGNNVVAVIGPVIDYFLPSVLSNAENKEIVHISPFATSDGFPTGAARDYVFLTTPPGSWGDEAAALDFDSIGIRSVVFLTSQDYYHTFEQSDIASRAASINPDIQIINIPYTISQVDGSLDPNAANLAAQAVAAGADAIFYSSYETDGAEIYDAVQALTYTGHSYRSIAAQGMNAAIGTAAAQGLLAESPVFNLISSAPFQAFLTQYKAWNNNNPPGDGVTEAQFFDVTVMLGLAIAKAGSTEGSAIRDALHSISSGLGTSVGPGDIATALSLIKQGQDITYRGATFDVQLDSDGDGILPWGTYECCDATDTVASFDLVVTTPLRVYDPNQLDVP